MSIDILKDRLPDYARDLKLNLSSLGVRAAPQPAAEAGSFIAAALAANHAPTTQAVVDAFARRAHARSAERGQDRGGADGDEQHLLPLRAPRARGRLQDPAGQAAHDGDGQARRRQGRLRAVVAGRSRRSTAAACAWRRTRKCAANTACRPSRSRPRCASPRRSTPSRARSAQKRRWRCLWRKQPRACAHGSKFVSNAWPMSALKRITDSMQGMARAHACWMLSPIVDDVDAGAAIAGIVRPVHGYALNFGAKSAGDEMPIGFVACHVRTSQQVRHAGGDRQSPARVEQPKIIVFGRSPVADCTEFDEASVCAGFAARPVVTHRERRDASGHLQSKLYHPDLAHASPLSRRTGRDPGKPFQLRPGTTGELPLAALGLTR